MVVTLVAADSLEPVTVTVETPPVDEMVDKEVVEVVELDTAMFAASMSDSGDAASNVSDVGLLQSVPPSSVSPQQCQRLVSPL